MANRKYISGGKVHEASGERKIIAGGKVLEETIAAAPGGLSIPIAAYHYNHNTGSKL